MLVNLRRAYKASAGPSTYWIPLGWRAVLLTVLETIVINDVVNDEEWKLLLCCCDFCCRSKSAANGPGYAAPNGGDSVPLIAAAMLQTFGRELSSKQPVT